jgi:peptidoglycan/LPS O-acetylase OafA/YrhL
MPVILTGEISKRPGPVIKKGDSEMKHRFSVLDIFRGIFASLVFFFHLNAYSQTPVLNNSFIVNSDLFVDFFFVLSGFVVCYTYQSISTSRELFLFYKKRFFRLYPLHLFLLFVFVAVEQAKSRFGAHGVIINNPNNDITTFLSNLFLLNSVKIPRVTDVSWNHPSWSISAEMLAYLAFGSIALFINRMGLSKYRNVFYITVAILALTLLFLITGGFDLMYTFDYGFLRGIAGFFLGAFCYTGFERSRAYFLTVRSSLYTLAEVTLLLSMIIMVSWGATLKPYGFVYEILFVLCIFTFSFEKGAVSGLLKKSSFLRRIGAYSYSIYMTHALFIGLFNILYVRLFKLPPSFNNYLLIVDYYIVYRVSAFTYKHVEIRFNYKKKIIPDKALEPAAAG